MIFCLLGLVFILAFLLTFGVVLSQSGAKKQAKLILSSDKVNNRKARKVLKTLSSCRDNEGKYLYTELVKRL